MSASTTSSSSSSTSTSSTASASASTTGIFANSSGGVSSSLYLFTFLITIVVLGVISAGLLLRAYYVRRQFQLRVEEAIRRGQPLPQDAVHALGLNRPRNGKDFGPMPSMWEAEMWRDGMKAEDKRDDKHWEGITPVAVVHFPTNDSTAIPPDYQVTDLPSRRGPFFLRPFLTPRFSENSPETASTRPNMGRADTGDSMQHHVPAFVAPGDGEEVTVGVMIALPVEEGEGAEKWTVEEEDEAEVPEVCLGVLECRVKDEM